MSDTPVRKKRRQHVLNKKKINFKINSIMYDLMISSFYTDNDIITAAFFKKLKQFMELVEPIDDDVNTEIKIAIIKHFLHHYLSNDIQSLDLIESLLDTEIGSLYSEKVSHIISNVEDMTEQEFLVLDAFVSQRLQYAHYYSFVPEIQDLALKISTNSIRDFDNINAEFEDKLSVLLQEINRAKEQDKYMAWDLDTSDEDTFHSKADGILKQLKSPSSTVVTGIKELNNMLGGGFRSARLYMFLMASGAGKSGILLNSVAWFKQFNTDIKPKDPTKIPVGLYITVENDMSETLERFFALMSDSKIEMDEFENINELMEEFNKSDLFEQDKHNVHVVLKYRPKNSLNAKGIRKMIDDLKAEGKEVCLLSVDYIKKLRADYPTGDPRIDLGNISDELSQIAKDYQIPVLTASQINRDGVAAIEKAEGLNKQMKSASSANVGESWLMIENSDVVITCFKEIRQSDTNPEKTEAYLGFKRDKMRGKLKSPKKSFVHPFADNSDMKFRHDIFMKTSLSIDEMKGAPKTFGRQNGNVTPEGGTKPKPSVQVMSKSLLSNNEEDEDEN